MTKSSNYWDNRALKRLDEAEKTSKEHIRAIKNMYEQAYRNIEKEIASVYKNYSKATGIDVQKLKELLTKKETDKVWDTLKRQGLDKYIQENYKSRISRLEQIQAQIYGKAKMLYTKEELEQTMCYNGVINNSYYKAIYDTQMGTGYDFSFNKINQKTINNLLSEKWAGSNYSERIWNNTDILASTVSQVVGAALLSGQGIEKTTRQIRDRFNVGKYYAERLVRTETNYFNNQSDALAYKEMGIDKYVFVATLDGRTSEMCQEKDNKVFDYSEMSIGDNFPPLHPNCRSKTRGYLGEEAEKLIERRARNPITGETEIVSNIPYSEWIKEYTIIEENIKGNQQNIAYNNYSLNTLDKKLVDKNITQLNKLLNKYPKVADFVKDNGLLFSAKKMSSIAVTTHTYDMQNLKIYLSKNYYKDYKMYHNEIANSINNKWFMPCSKNNIDIYPLNHEFGHLVENYLINEYNKNNLLEYGQYMNKINTATTSSQISSIVKQYEKNICDKIANEICNIVLKNNKNFSFSNNLSKYGDTKSQEFFAECFANMVSGKPNELGKAMKEYLKGVM